MISQSRTSEHGIVIFDSKFGNTAPDPQHSISFTDPIPPVLSLKIALMKPSLNPQRVSPADAPRQS